MRSSPYSRWHEEIGKYLAFRSTYYTSRWPAQPLHLFDRFAASHPRWTLTQAITQWLNSGGDRHPVTRSNYLSAIRMFCEYRRRFESDGFVPTQIMPVTAAKRNFQAYILTPEQISSLLQKIPSLRGPPLRLARMRVLLLVLYCTGLRIGEALRLHLSDVDLKKAYFRVGPSKGRTRLVPFGRDLASELNRWLQARRDAGIILSPQTPLFEREDGRPDNVWNAEMRFNTLFRHCGLKPKRGSGRVGLAKYI
jgi:integrase/recombinase XerD